MANITLEELALEVALLRRKLDRLTPSRLITLAEFSRDSGLSPHQIRYKIQQSIARPADSQLQNGIHYVCTQSGKRGGKILINPELFCEAIGLSL
jgi:hypothetical protein